MTEHPIHCGPCRAPGVLTLTPEGPHHGRRNCPKCGRWLEWEPAPMTPGRAADFVVPFGKYEGRALGRAAAEDPRYFHWALTGCRACKGSFRRAVEMVLASIEVEAGP